MTSAFLHPFASPTRESFITLDRGKGAIVWDTGHLGNRLGDGAIAGARGAGALWAAAMHAGLDAADVRAAMLERGVIVRPIGNHSITFCPPLVTTDGRIDTSVDALPAVTEAG